MIWENHPACSLIGKKITSVRVSEYHLFFCLEGGEFLSYYVEGECCSYSRWTDITNVDSILDQTVLSVGEYEPSPRNFPDYSDFEQAYGFELITENGRAQFAFQNSSNGYYGGWIEFGGASEPNDSDVVVKNHWSL